MAGLDNYVLLKFFLAAGSQHPNCAENRGPNMSDHVLLNLLNRGSYMSDHVLLN